MNVKQSVPNMRHHRTWIFKEMEQQIKRPISQPSIAVALSIMKYTMAVAFGIMKYGYNDPSILVESCGNLILIFLIGENLAFIFFYLFFLISSSKT